MHSAEEMCQDPVNPVDLAEVEVNETEVTTVRHFGRQWYQLGGLFKALDFPKINDVSLAANVGNQFFETGEFKKFKGVWYGTVKGLSIYADHLRESRLSLQNPEDKAIAHMRCLNLTNWLADVWEASLETNGSKACPSGCNVWAEPAIITVRMGTTEVDIYAGAGEQEIEAVLRVLK